MSNHSNHLRFAEGFSIDLEKKILWFNGSRSEVPTKAVEVLCALVEGNGDVVSREDLLTKVWADSFVEEAVLTQNIYMLRKIFKEHDIAHDLIETIPRRGYRFHADPLEDSGEFETVTIERSFLGQAYMTEVSEEPRATSTVEEKDHVRPGLSRYKVPLISAAVVVLAIAGTLAFYSFSTASGGSPAEQRAVVRYEPLSNSARALYTGLSATGEYAAYVLHTPDNKYSLMLHHIPSKSETEVVAPQERHLYSIQFAPDGNSIYFGGSKAEEKGAVYRIPTFGGTPEYVTKRPEHHFSISPDGLKIAMYRRVAAEAAHYLDVCSITDENECRILTKVGDGSSFKLWGAGPAWSSDGKKLLVSLNGFEGPNKRRRQYLAEVDAETGKMTEIGSPAWHAVHQAFWSPDSSTIYVMVRENAEDNVQLWSLNTKTGAAKRLTNDDNDYREFRPSPDGRFLIANTWLRAENLFLVSLEDPKDFRQLTFEDSVSNGANGVKWLASENEVVYAKKDGSATTNLWRLNTETLESSQVTFDKAAFSKSIDATVGGAAIYHVSDRSGKVQIYRSNKDGSGLVQITTGPGTQNAEVSPDGEKLYYAIGETLWKENTSGSGRSKVLDISTGIVRVSPADSTMIAAFYFDHREREGTPWKFGIFREGLNKPLQTFHTRPVVFEWKPDGSGLYFIDSGETFSNVWFQPLDGSEPTKITNFADQKISNFSVAADGRSMVLSRGMSTSRVIKIDLGG